MITFRSASTRAVNAGRAIAECVEAALGAPPAPCDVLVVHAGMGHDFAALSAAAQALLPGARIFVGSCAGVVGRERVSETLQDVAVMAITGADELATAHVTGVTGETAEARCRDLAQALVDQQPALSQIFLMAPGIDIAADRCVAGIEAVVGPEVTIFGATTGDNMRGNRCRQAIDGTVHETAAFAVGFADPTLRAATTATHGFAPAGPPMTITRAAANAILELDGAPAWEHYTQRLALPPSATCADTLPLGALAVVPPRGAGPAADDGLLLRTVTQRGPGGGMRATAALPPGTVLQLTRRDEDQIFAAVDHHIRALQAEIGDGEVVAVFHADCAARGRSLFHRVLKDELMARLQHPLSTAGRVPPWLGTYGFGEFIPVGGRNAFQNYTTALAALVRAV